MRTGLFYGLFVFIALMIVSPKLKDKKQTFDDISSCQLVNVNKPHDYLVIEIKLFPGKPVPEFKIFHFTNEKFIRKAYDQKITLPLTHQRLDRPIPIGSKLIEPLFRVSMHYTAEKEDNHYLS